MQDVLCLYISVCGGGKQNQLQTNFVSNTPRTELMFTVVDINSGYNIVIHPTGRYQNGALEREEGEQSLPHQVKEEMV